MPEQKDKGNPFGRALTREDIEYMSEVDAALARRGHPYAYLLSLAVGGSFLMFIIWAAFASLDEVTHGQGQVIPSQRVQVIQNLEGGIIREIMVRENQVVEKDAVLVRIDNEAAESYYRDAQTKSIEHQLAIIRLEAELEGKEPMFPANIEGASPQIFRDQLAIHAARRQQFEAEVRVLESQNEQKRREVDEMTGRKAQLEAGLRLAREQRDIARPLMEKQIYSKVDYLSLEQRVISLQGDINSLAQNIPRARAAAQEAMERLGFRKAEHHSQIVEEINKRRAEMASLKETLAAGGDRVTRTDVRSPVRGTVKRLILNTVGGVIKPGEPIMEVVPLDDTLLVEARIRPADIAFLHPQQRAVVKITAYDYSIYGGLEAEVEQISADTIEDRKGEFYYLVKLRTNKGHILYKGEMLPIMPGMTATVDVLTGKKTVLDYLLKPILKARQNALRER